MKTFAVLVTLASVAGTCAQVNWSREGEERRPVQNRPIISKVVTTTGDGFRIIQSNGIPDHQPGEFPRRGNPNTMSAQSYSFRVPLEPKMAERPIPSRHAWFGVALNGVPFEPGTGEFWEGRREWNFEAMTGHMDLGIDEHHAHVQPGGEYHYHGLPTGLIQREGGDNNQMCLVGYGADGFPIYTARGHVDAKDPASPLKAMRSSYQMKKGSRPQSEDSPGGRYDGTFTADYAYQAGSGDLDECNGRFGVTPEYPAGIYHYYITEDFPFISRMWRGIPDPSFEKAGGPPPRFARRGPPSDFGFPPERGRHGFDGPPPPPPLN